MIKKQDYFTIVCDNCKEQFIDEHSGYAAMATESQIRELADNNGWIVDYHAIEDSKKIIKHYCPLCAKLDEDIDDMIYVNETRFKK